MSSCCRITDLRCKEVINLYDGCRMGYVGDVEVDTLCGRVVSIVVPGRCHFFGLLGRDEDYVIAWEQNMNIILNEKKEKNGGLI